MSQSCVMLFFKKEPLRLWPSLLNKFHFQVLRQGSPHRYEWSRIKTDKFSCQPCWFTGILHSERKASLLRFGLSLTLNRRHQTQIGLDLSSVKQNLEEGNKLTLLSLLGKKKLAKSALWKGIPDSEPLKTLWESNVLFRKHACVWSIPVDERYAPDRAASARRARLCLWTWWRQTSSKKADTEQDSEQKYSLCIITIAKKSCHLSPMTEL